MRTRNGEGEGGKDRLMNSERISHITKLPFDFSNAGVGTVVKTVRTGAIMVASIQLPTELC